VARIRAAEQQLESERRGAERHRGLSARRLAIVEEARADIEPRLDALSAQVRRTRDAIHREPKPPPPPPEDGAAEELVSVKAALAAATAELEESRAAVERNAAESQIVRMVTRAEAEGEKERRVEAEQAAERAAAERGAAREALAEARARLEDLERQEGALAARIREERQRREDLQVRLAAVARAADPAGEGPQPIDDLERRLVTLRDELQRADLVG
jgi:chromosome segregation ATPase